jgi:hypothetical protein
MRILHRFLPFILKSLESNTKIPQRLLLDQQIAVSVMCPMETQPPEQSNNCQQFVKDLKSPRELARIPPIRHNTAIRDELV